jgi:hypothetical protein
MSQVVHNGMYTVDDRGRVRGAKFRSFDSAVFGHRRPSEETGGDAPEVADETDDPLDGQFLLTLQLPVLQSTPSL